MTLIQAQQLYIDRVNNPNNHPGHLRRVRRGAWRQLYDWATQQGSSPEQARQVCQDARDVADLERDAED